MWVRNQWGDLVNLRFAESVEVVDVGEGNADLVATMRSGETKFLWHGKRGACESKTLTLAGFIEDGEGFGVMTLGTIERKAGFTDGGGI